MLLLCYLFYSSFAAKNDAFYFLSFFFFSSPHFYYYIFFSGFRGPRATSQRPKQPCNRYQLIGGEGKGDFKQSETKQNKKIQGKRTKEGLPAVMA